MTHEYKPWKGSEGADEGKGIVIAGEGNEGRGVKKKTVKEILSGNPEVQEIIMKNELFKRDSEIRKERRREKETGRSLITYWLHEAETRSHDEIW